MLARDIGIDLGTANVLIYLKGKGIVLNEPSVVVVDTETKKVIAVGNEANEMLGRTPGKIKAIKPMKDGVIADFEIAEIMLKEFIKKAKARRTIARPRILICCPTNITPVEKNAIREAAEQAGARKVSVLSMNGIVSSSSIKIAGNTLNQDLIKYMRDKYKFLIGEPTAEDIKINFTNIYKPSKKEKREIKGRDLITGLPKKIEITQQETKEALEESINKIIKVIKNVLEQTPPELSSDIVEKGIILTGGGSLLTGLVERLEEELTIPVLISESPLTCVAEGTGILLENVKQLTEEE